MSSAPEAKQSNPLDPQLAERLSRRALELVDTLSVSRSEAAIADYVERAVDGQRLRMSFAADDCRFFAPERRAELPLIVVAGHLDTVPPQGNIPGRIDTSQVHGLGASDMKAGLAVMVELARWLEQDAPVTSVDIAFLFFSREELTVEESPIPALLAAEPLLRAADLVVIMEPTANVVQLGCLGNLNADACFAGESSHSARPWLGVNAIHNALLGLQEIALRKPSEILVDGLPFVEVVNVTGIEGGIARNVIPDEVVCHINFRYAPGRSKSEAEEELRALVPKADVRIVGNAPPARVVLDNPLVAKLQRVSGSDFEPKQAWTNVAEFSAAGIDAVNFGPGDPELAHRADERVAIRSLVESYLTLQRWVTGAHG
ncbi:MAG: succinyl-diaminopimelate desuccinylase [Actinomycetota bacterium]